MKHLELDKNKIYEYQQNREPYLMIDYASEVVPEKAQRVIKILKKMNGFLKFIGKMIRNVPGMLQIEALVQMAALSILSLPGNKGKVVYLISANNLKFSKKITPDSRLYIETEIIKFNRGIATCSGSGFVEEQIACKAEFNLILPEEIKKYNVK